VAEWVTYQLRRVFRNCLPADLTVTGLAKALTYSWAEQERDVGLAPCP
jgi:hypothetical protein